MAQLPQTGLESVDFGADGLVPAVAQDVRTGEVLMLGYMNRAMLAKTLETGDAWFWSRSRQRAWHKGETSGHVLRVRAVRKNCYDNSLLLLVEPAGPVCHTGARTCYFRALDGTPVASAGSNVQGSKSEVPDAAAGSGEPDDRPDDRAGHEWRGAEEDGLDWLFGIVRQRQAERPDGSYVVQLLDAGVDRIAKKVGEEAAEVIIAAKNRTRDALANEVADLWFHSLVLLADAGLAPPDVYRVLAARHQARPRRREQQ